MAQISMDGISKHFGHTRALEKVDLEVEQGEFVTILGPSGSGKTTMLSIVAGLLQPTSGEIRIGGEDVTDLPAHRRNVGLVFQSYALFPHIDVASNIGFPLRVRKVDRASIKRRVTEALELVQLSGYERRRPHELSGGQQQRVALARAFVFEPAMLLLDEPLGALDRKLREQVQIELHQLQRSLGITALLVTHDQEEALSMSDRLAVLDDGTLQQVGSPEDVYLRPVNKFVADFLGAANFFEAQLRSSSASDSVVVIDDQCMPGGPSSLREGTGVCVMVRPERITISPTETTSGLPAIVQESIYLGKYVRYHLKTSSGQEVVINTNEITASARPGQHVTLTWGPSDAWIIPPSTKSESKSNSTHEERPLTRT